MSAFYQGGARGSRPKGASGGGGFQLHPVPARVGSLGGTHTSSTTTTTRRRRHGELRTNDLQVSNSQGGEVTWLQQSSAS